MIMKSYYDAINFLLKKRWTAKHICMTNKPYVVNVEVIDHNTSIASRKEVQNQLRKFQIPITNSKLIFFLLEASVCTMFQVASSYNHGVRVAKVVFGIFALRGPTIRDGHPNINRHLA